MLYSNIFSRNIFCCGMYPYCSLKVHTSRWNYEGRRTVWPQVRCHCHSTQPNWREPLKVVPTPTFCGCEDDPAQNLQREICMYYVPQFRHEFLTLHMSVIRIKWILLGLSIHSKKRMWCSALLQVCIRMACASKAFKEYHARSLIVTKPFLFPDTEARHYPNVTEFHDNMGPAVDIQGLNKNRSSRFNNSVPTCRNPWSAAPSAWRWCSAFWWAGGVFMATAQHSFKYSCGLIIVTAIQPIFQPFNLFIFFP